MRKRCTPTQGVVVERIEIAVKLDPWLSLRNLARYSGLSVRTLRAHLEDALDPIPCYRPGGAHSKVLVRVSEFDSWMRTHRQVGRVDIDGAVTEILRDLPVKDELLKNR